ncbi:hypothetical protein FRB94_010270 [Tulasnella sp. JGI-2019a]|nr:hypothetical protein FRB94_010270 [Tulasnella sp. JGI-2019a]KAG9012362.1 hypothetical protein FRB93_001784 [Tulasnella sp. JGI-2019a]KAG9036138.1 hypothetical protein FRB95_009712 [Tulasnella sp. JGI-2019a]
MSDAPPPAFPTAHIYGGYSPTTELPNPFDISQQFDALNIKPQSPLPSSYVGGDWRQFPVRQNSDANRPPPAAPTSPPASTARPPIPNVLTPGSRYGQMQSEARPAETDYLPPLRNPVPRPPQMIPRRDDYGSDPYYSTSQAHSVPPNASFPSNSWNYPLSTTAGSSVEPSAGRPSLSAPNSTDLASAPGRASSVPPSSTVSASTSSADGVTQCAGVTKSNTRCTRLVKVPAALGVLNPEDEIPRFCFQHAKEMLAVTGFYSRGNRVWVDFDDWIPKYMQEDTKVLLRSEMEKPISKSDVEGYIYCYELRDTKNTDIVNLKVGRAVNLVKRIDEWTKSCESKEPILRGWFPGPDEADHADISLMKGRVQAGSKGKNCHRLERLIHLELADLSINKPYLTPEFDGKPADGDGNDDDGKKPKSKSKAADKPKAKAKGKATAKVKKPKKTPQKKSKRRVYSDTEDDEDEDEDYEEAEDEEEEEEEEEEEKAATPAPPSPVATKSRPRMKVQVRPPCKDCGQVHKEIFTFQRPTEGRLKDHEWERIVHPVIEKWGGFVETYT